MTSVVQLQMQNYNLDNELKAQRQVSAKLKEEVHMYRAELDKLLCDKTSLLTLTGNNVSTLCTCVVHLLLTFWAAVTTESDRSGFGHYNLHSINYVIYIPYS